MTGSQAEFVCCQCKQAQPIGELAVAFSGSARGGRGYCLVCYTLLSGNEPLRMSRSLANQVESALAEISTDWFTKQ